MRNWRTCRASSPSVRRGAFTLIELLSVIAIVAVLISFVLAAVGVVNQHAKLVQCESNLRQWGQVAYNFAVDHRGRFPQAYGNRIYGSTPTLLTIPTTLTGDDLPDPWNVSDPNIGNWLAWGTSWNQFKRYGLTWSVALCPSTAASSWSSETTSCWSNRPEIVGVENTGGNPVWGSVIYHLNYQYVGGLAASLNQPPSYLVATTHWGKRVPAGKASEKGLSEKVLAADAVADYVYWDQGYMVNHPVRGKPGCAKYINVLFGDGHVACDVGPFPCVGPDFYSVSWVNGQSPYFYWGH